MATTKVGGADKPSGPKSVTKVGNLTSDPELLFGKESKKPLCRVRIAVNTPATEGDWAGERLTDFYNIYPLQRLRRKRRRVGQQGSSSRGNWPSGSSDLER
jgi:single-stranded DNA-binding protein